MKKPTLILISALFAASNLIAQTYFTEALKFIQTFPSGTARSSSMGGAFGALGGDMYSLSVNPAGLGVYRKSELVFTPSYSMQNTSASYYGTNREDFNNKFNINNLGFVTTIDSKKNSGFINFSFGFAYNQLKNFNNNILIEGNNYTSSLADKFIDDAWGMDPEDLDPFGARLAFDAFLMDTAEGTNYEYYALVPFPIDQRKTIETKGNIGEMSFSVGTNYNNVLYLGASFTTTRIYYDETSYHQEFDNDNLNDFDNFNYEYTYNSIGTGYGLKLGFIAKPVEFIRFGGSFQFPTVFKLSEEYDAYMFSRFDNGDTYSVDPTYSDGSLIEFGSFDYKLLTPFKTTGSLGFQFGKIGLLSIDAEYIDYSKARLRNRNYNYDFNPDNSGIQDALRKVLNIRTGGEIRFNQVSVRGGFAYFPSPYQKNEINEKSSYTDITGGLGIREKNFFIDLGLVYTMHKEKYNVYHSYSEYYSDYSDNIAAMKQNNLRILATVGFRF